MRYISVLAAGRVTWLLFLLFSSPLAANMMPQGLPMPVRLQEEVAARLNVDVPLPPALALDVELFRHGAVHLAGACTKWLDAARALAAAEPQRSGPFFLLARCAEARDERVAAAGLLSQAKALAQAQRAPPLLWQGELAYEAGGTSDALAVLAFTSGEPIAEILEASLDGARLFQRYWLRDSRGRVQRLRVDVTPFAERLAGVLAQHASDDDAAVIQAMPGIVGVLMLAESGSSAALNGRARLIARTAGFGSAEDARTLLRRAAGAGDLYARYLLADWLLYKHPDLRDYTEAVALLRQTGAAGLPEAQVLMSLLCREQPVHCSEDEIARWKAAAVVSAGAAEAALLRHAAYARLSVLGKAESAWLALGDAADAGSIEAIDLYLDRQQRAPDVSEHMARLQRLQQFALKQHGARACYLQVEEQLRKAVTPRARQRALSSLRALAEQGQPEAAVALGNALYRGTDLARDYTAAADWYRRAAQRGQVAGQVNYAQVLKMGKGVAVDKAAARLWRLRAALQGGLIQGDAIVDVQVREVGTDRDGVRESLFREWTSGGLSHASNPLVEVLKASASE